MKNLSQNFLYVIACAFFCVVLLEHLFQSSQLYSLNEDSVRTDAFRNQQFESDMEEYVRGVDASYLPKVVGIYLLETKFSRETFPHTFEKKTFEMLAHKWKKNAYYSSYMRTVNAIWKDIKYFPIPVSTRDENLTVSYKNSWMNERTYGGKRGHEGTDIMASNNTRGMYPIVSITDGVILNKGWLEKGGYRLLIKAPSGACYYYAHLDSYANLEEGDKIKAGQLLGFMGDTGYGKEEGTRGKFPVHLHLGIYIYLEGEEISVNSYEVVKYLEDHKLKWAYS